MFCETDFIFMLFETNFNFMLFALMLVRNPPVVQRALGILPSSQSTLVWYPSFFHLQPSVDLYFRRRPRALTTYKHSRSLLF